MHVLPSQLSTSRMVCKQNKIMCNNKYEMNDLPWITFSFFFSLSLSLTSKAQLWL